jgi:outer membrane protein OmpA-like peptidoglycan-associated protein
MTRLPGISGRKAIALSAVLSMMTGAAFAGDDLADEIIRSLSKPRGIHVDNATGNKENEKNNAFIDSLRSKGTRSLSTGERDEIANIATTKPALDLDVQFDYNSADIRSSSMPTVQSLGEALTKPGLKGLTFMVAGHTDATGGESYNQELSERRAETIKKYLVDKFGIAGTDLIAVGFGKNRLKKPDAPADAANRRVEVVNMESKNASK